MSAENLKGCCPHAHAHESAGSGTVDHSVEIPGGGSQDPTPLRVISADSTHLIEGVSALTEPIPPKVGPGKLPVILNTTANLDTLPAPRLSPKACTPKYIVYQCGCGRRIVPSSCMSLDCIVCQPHVTRRRSEAVFKRLTMGHNRAVIYSVFTTPLQVREKYYDRGEWQKARRRIWKFLKKHFGAQFGVEVSHPVGDSDGKLFHPHLNFLWVQRKGWSPFINVDLLREKWAKVLGVEQADVYTQYAGNKAMVKHWTNYVCRTFPGMHTWTGPVRWYGRYPLMRKPAVMLCADCGLPYSVVGEISSLVVDDYNKTGWLLGLDPPWLDDSQIMHYNRSSLHGKTRYQHG